MLFEMAVATTLVSLLVDIPSVPVGRNVYQDLRRRMLETPPPIGRKNEDQESRKFQYLQENPGPKIRDHTVFELEQLTSQRSMQEG
jgi:hypothetical protein